MSVPFFCMDRTIHTIVHSEAIQTTFIYIVKRSQHLEKLNVWAGTSSSKITVQFSLQSNLIRQVYLILRQELAPWKLAMRAPFPLQCFYGNFQLETIFF